MLAGGEVTEAELFDIGLRREGQGSLPCRVGWCKEFRTVPDAVDRKF